jgi:uroporphyrinogen decarboxylase
MMRQAGRYLPEYRALRAEEAFFEVCRTPELASELTIQPIERFAVDAAIIFSDILVVPQAMGMEVEIVKGEGPHFLAPIETPADLARLTEPDVARDLGYVFDAISLTRRRLDGRVPLIGFCGAPWTLMTYMVEGGGSKTFSKARSWLYRHPSDAHELLERLTDVLIRYLLAQAEAGAQVLQVFDTWAGLLGPAAFESFAYPHLREIARSVKKARPDVPLIVFARGSHYAHELLADTDYDVIGLDWTVSPATARREVAGRAALQGNLDPAVLYADPDGIRREVRRMLEEFGPAGHIANLGHGMHPDHDPESARAFVDAVHEISEELRGDGGFKA